MILLSNKTKKLLNLFLSAALLPFCISCYQDIIDLELDGMESRIVIEGIVSNKFGSTQVKISKTSGIYDDESILPVSGAMVNISDNHGNSEILNETSDGIYRTSNIRRSPGTTYFLNVEVDGKEYTAESKYPLPIILDSTKITRQNTWSTSHYLEAFFSEHPGDEDYCLINFYQNGYFLWWDQILYSDKFRDGQPILIDNLDTEFFLHDVVKIEVFTFEKPIYEYYSVIKDLDNEDYSEDEEEPLFDLASANPPSNISNNGLGYFSAQAYYSFQFQILE